MYANRAFPLPTIHTLTWRCLPPKQQRLSHAEEGEACTIFNSDQGWDLFALPDTPFAPKHTLYLLFPLCWRHRLGQGLPFLLLPFPHPKTSHVCLSRAMCNHFCLAGEEAAPARPSPAHTIPSTNKVLHEQEGRRGKRTPFLTLLDIHSFFAERSGSPFGGRTGTGGGGIPWFGVESFFFRNMQRRRPHISEQHRRPCVLQKLHSWVIPGLLMTFSAATVLLGDGW